MSPTRYTILASVFILFGLAIAAGSTPLLAAPLNLMADLIILPFDGAPDLSETPIRLFAAITGGLMAGWGVMIALLGRGAELNAALFWGGVSWFIVDSSGSIASGAAFNVIPNLAFLALFLWASRGVKRSAETASQA